MLKNKSELLQKENKDLFGKEFREQISETVNGHKQSKELLASAVFKDTATGNQFFRKGPLLRKRHSQGGVLTKTTAGERAGTSIGITSTIVHMKMKTTFQGDTKSDSMRKIAICSQADKKIILVE